MSVDGVGRLQKGFATRQAPTPAEYDKKLREVAELYEKQFLREMVKSMRSTVNDSGLVPVSQAEKIFREQLDDQYVEGWGARGGVGIADMIHEQLLQKFGEQFGIRAPAEKPRGPIKLDQMTLDGQKKVPGTLGFQTKSGAKAVEVMVQDSAKASHEVTPAWSGTLTSIEQTEDGENLLGINHAGGFRSLMKFRGELTANLRPGPVEAGQPLGVWDSGQGGMKWNLKFGQDSASE